MKLKIEKVKNFTVIYLVGRMDIVFVNSIEDEYSAALNELNSFGLVLDMSQVFYISSSALRIIVSTIRLCEEKSIKLVLVGLNKEVRKTFELVNLNNIVEIHPNMDEVIKKYS